MDKKKLLSALNVLEKREHLLKTIRYQLEAGIISEKVFREREAEILRKYRLYPDQQRALEEYERIQSDRRRKRN